MHNANNPLILREFYLKVRPIHVSSRKEIWLMRNTLDDELCMAKIQPIFSVHKHGPTVLHEGKVMQSCQGHLGVPQLYWAGRDEGAGVMLLIIEKLGVTVEARRVEMGGQLETKTVCMLGIRMFEVIRALHEKGYAHGSLTPRVFQFGSGSRVGRLYVNDLMDYSSYNRKGKHAPRDKIKKRIANINQFMSFDRMQGYEPTRKDDVESIISILIFMLRGSLPWSQLFGPLEAIPIREDPPDSVRQQMNSEVSSQEKSEEQGEKFEVNPAEYEQMVHSALCQADRVGLEELGEGLPEFRTMLGHCRTMEYCQKPDYNVYVRALRSMMLRRGEEEDGVWEWMKRGDSRLKAVGSHKLKLVGEEALLKKCYEPFERKVELE